MKKIVSVFFDTGGTLNLRRITIDIAYILILKFAKILFDNVALRKFKTFV